MFSEIQNDIRVVKDRDPAAKNTLEIILCYSGLHGVTCPRNLRAKR